MKILQISQKDTCGGVLLFNKDEGCRPVTLTQGDHSIPADLWLLQKF